MAAIARPGVCENRDGPMSKKFRGPTTSIVTGKVPAPVRVKLKRVNCEQAIPYPPDGQARECRIGPGAPRGSRNGRPRFE